MFALFVSLGGLLRGILVVHWKRLDTQVCTFGEPHLRAPPFKNTTTIEREDTRERQKERKWGREGEKKSEILGGLA